MIGTLQFRLQFIIDSIMFIIITHFIKIQSQMSTINKFAKQKKSLNNDYIYFVRDQSKQKKYRNEQIQEKKLGMQTHFSAKRKSIQQNNSKELDLSNIQKLMKTISKNQAQFFTMIKKQLEKQQQNTKQMHDAESMTKSNNINKKKISLKKQVKTQFTGAIQKINKNLIQNKKLLVNQIKSKVEQKDIQMPVSTSLEYLLYRNIQDMNNPLIKNQKPAIQQIKIKSSKKNQRSNSELKQTNYTIQKNLIQNKLYQSQFKQKFEQLNDKKRIQIKEELIESNKKPQTINLKYQQQAKQTQNLKNTKLLKNAPKYKFQHQIYMSEADPKDEIIDFSLDDFEYLNYTIVRQFFIQVFERVLSKSHYYYIKDIFSKKDAKNYCTKNILYNVKKVLELKQIWNKNQSKKEQKFEYPQQNIQLTVQSVNKLLKEITDANLKRYPQKISSGVNQRVLQVVPKTNLLQSDQYDFLFLNKINITHKNKPNYFSQIMETINKMIQIPNQQIDRLAQSTYFDIFREILNIMIVYSTSQVAKEQQNNKQFKKKKKQNKNKLTKGDLYSEYINEVIEDLLIQKLKIELEQIDLNQQEISQKVEQIFLIKTKKREKNNSQIFNPKQIKQYQRNFNDQDLKNTQHNYQSHLNDDKIKQKLKNLYANLKISSKAKKFTQSQVQEGQLEINDSTILRILTKWAEQLQEKFKQPQNKILKRTELFKNNQFRLTDIQQMEAEQNQLYKLFTNVLKEKCKNSIQKFLQIIKQQNHYYQQIFGEETVKGVYINDLVSDVNLFGVKIQKFSGYYILSYLNLLIHQLTEVPSKVIQNEIFQTKKKQEGKQDFQQQKKLRTDLYNEQQISKIKDINLITLKIGDLMRGKYSCSQTQFIRLMGIMENFSKFNSNIMKIIRVKNRLEAKDNDILMNILFMNKIQCEFQLSLTSDHSLQALIQKKTNQFNHYLYEISRSILGPISQLSGILVQEDPLIKDHFAKNLKNLKKISIFPLNYQKNKNKKQHQNQSIKKIKEKADLLLYNQNIKNCKKMLPFQCQNSKCRQITLLNNDINLDLQAKICLVCSINQILKLDQQNKKGFQLIKKFINQNNAKIFQNQSQFVYEEQFQYFDHTNIKTFEKVMTIDDLLFAIPKVGVFINIKEKKPQIKLFMTHQINQQIIVFYPNQDHKEMKFLNRNNNLNFAKVKIIGKFKFSDSQNAKYWTKAIPKAFIIWGFKQRNIEQLSMNQLFSQNIASMQKQLQKFNLGKHEQNLLKTINYQYMWNLLLQRKSNVNINRFVKITSQMLNNLFKNLKKDVSHIKQFKANKSIFFQDQTQDQTYMQIQSQFNDSIVNQLVKRNVVNEQVNWMNDLLIIQRLDIKSNNITKKLLQFLLEAKADHLRRLKHLQISSNNIGSVIQKISFKNLTQLQVLKCSDNKIRQIQSLESLKQLREVEFNQNQLLNCQFIKQNFNIKILELADNQITQISCLKKLNQLQKLNLKNNSLSRIQVCANFTKLKNLNLKNNNLIKQLSYIGELNELEYLNLQGCDSAFDINLKKCIKLKTLYLGKTLICKNLKEQIKDTNKLIQKIQNCKNIKILYLNSTLIRYQDLQQMLQYLSQIQHLNLNNCKNLQKIKIKNCKHIKTLDLSQTNIKQCDLQQFSQLEKLDLRNCQYLQKIKIKNCNTIKRLDLSQTLIDELELLQLSQLLQLGLNNCRNLQNINIKNCTNIKTLDLTSTKIKQNELQQILLQLRQLQMLSLSNCENIQNFKIINSKNIKILDLSQTTIEQNDLQSILQQLQKLQQLGLNNCKLLKNIKIKNCKSIKTLDLSQTTIKQAFLQQLPQLQLLGFYNCQNLENIKIKNCVNIKILDISQLIVKQVDLQLLPQLQQLDFRNCQNLQNIKIKNCKNIKTLNLSSTTLNSIYLQQIFEQLKQLQQLGLSNCKHTQSINLKQCKKIKTLDLSYTKLNQYNLEQLLIQLRQLQQLSLSNCKNLQNIKIKNCKRIKILDLSQTEIQQIFLQQLPQIQLINFHNCQYLENIKIKNCKIIEVLNLSSTSVKFVELQQLPKLSQLNLRNCQNFHKIKVKNCKNIKMLDLSETSIKQSIFQIINQLSQLQQICLFGCSQLQSASIKQLKQIKIIDLQFSVIEQILLQDLSQLEFLNLSSCQHLQVIQIKNCKKMQRILCDNSNVFQNQDLIKKLVKQMPNVKIQK